MVGFCFNLYVLMLSMMYTQISHYISTYPTHIPPDKDVHADTYMSILCRYTYGLDTPVQHSSRSQPITEFPTTKTYLQQPVVSVLVNANTWFKEDPSDVDVSQLVPTELI